MTPISAELNVSAEINKQERGKKMRKLMQTIVGTFLGLAILFAGAQIFVSAQDKKNQEQRQEQKDGRSIGGTWRTSVTPVNCQIGAPVAPAFPGLLSFHDGGTLSGTSTVAPTVFGVWESTRGWQNYSFAFTNLRYNTSGVFIGTQTVRQTAKLGAAGNDFTSTGTVEIFDTNGNLIGTGCANSTGTRFE